MRHVHALPPCLHLPQTQEPSLLLSHPPAWPRWCMEAMEEEVEGEVDAMEEGEVEVAGDMDDDG